MGKRLVMTIFPALAGLFLYGQKAQGSLLGAGSCFYKQKLRVFGFEQRGQELVFRCFSYGVDLVKRDSAEHSLGRSEASKYLTISCDTLHDVLSFYFQKADQKNRASLCRLDSNLRLLATATDLDASHIHAIAAFSKDHHYQQHNLYTITTAEDSSGLQFYLSKYSLKAPDKPFEYDFKWQYPFERKFIHHAAIIYADAAAVLLYAHVSDGPKKGQWLLRVNARNGSLLKALKLNPKGDERHFLYATAAYDRSDKSISLTGSVLPAGMIDFKKGQADFKNLPTSYSLFLLRLDSLGDISARYEKALPLPLSETAKAPLHLKIRSLTKTEKNSYVLWADLYEAAPNNVMSYYSSWQMQLSADQQNLVVKSTTPYPLRKLVPDLLSTAPGNDYGKIRLGSIADYDQFHYAPARSPVLIYSGTDSKGQLLLLLRKVNLGTGQNSWLEAYTSDKGPIIRSIYSSGKGQSASVYPSGRKYILFSSDAAKNQFQLESGEL